MANDVGRINGNIQVYNPQTNQFDLVENELIVTRFWGGIENGVCIQITTTKDSYTQLDHDGVKKLIGVLQEYLEYSK